MKNYQLRRGAAAAVALSTVLILLVVSLGVTGLSVGTLRRSDRDSSALICHQAAVAGLELQIARAKRNLRGDKGKFVTTNVDSSAVIAPIAAGAAVTTQVDPLTDRTFAWVTSTARYRGQTRSVRALINSRFYSIWDNVIFAGAGSAAAMTGNTTMRGSVHILGTGEPYLDLNNNGRWDPGEKFTDKNKNGVWDPGEAFVDSNGDKVCNVAEPFNDLNKNRIYDLPMAQLDVNSSLKGGASVGNNYEGMPSGVRSSIVDPPKTATGLETLNSKFRVKHGRISLSGNGQIGEPNDTTTSKGKMDGIFVSDGFVGNKPDGSIHSDNGYTNPYDMHDLNPSFPLISGIGAGIYEDAKGNTWTTQERFLDAVSMTVPVTSITSATAAFSYGPDTNGNSIAFQPATKTTPSFLTVFGIVRFAGNLQLGTPKETVYIRGRGTLYAKGDINIDCSLLPVAGLKFPTDTALGFIAQSNMNLATGSGASQLEMVGAFYAQCIVTSRKTNEIAGTFVGSSYDMGTNVPAVYQVPALVDNMPPGMPGDFRRYDVKVLTWRDRQTRPGT